MSRGNEAVSGMSPDAGMAARIFVSQHDELLMVCGVTGATTYDVDLSHSGRKIARKPGERNG
jgi:hypothetical protein